MWIASALSGIKSEFFSIFFFTGILFLDFYLEHATRYLLQMHPATHRIYIIAKI